MNIFSFLLDVHTIVGTALGAGTVFILVTLGIIKTGK